MITTTTQQPDDLAGILHINSDLLQSDHAQRAWHTGLLEAKREAMQRARQLERWGRPLLVAVIAVSFLHVWESIAAIRPAFVTDLQLPSEVYHAAAAAFTIAIDLAALYVVAASQTIALAGARKSRWASGFFLFLTLLLNMAYIGRHAPSLPDELRAGLLPLLNIAFILLLPAFIPIAIFAVEAATQRVIAARLKLLVEVRTLEQLTSATPAAAPAREHTPAARPSRPVPTPTPAVEIRTLEQHTYAASMQEHAPAEAAHRTAPAVEIHTLEQRTNAAPMREHAPAEPAAAPMQEHAPSQERAPAPAFVEAPALHTPRASNVHPSLAYELDDILTRANLTRDDARALLARFGLTSADAAHNMLKRFGKLPASMQPHHFVPLYHELMDAPHPAASTEAAMEAPADAPDAAPMQEHAPAEPAPRPVPMQEYAPVEPAPAVEVRTLEQRTNAAPMQEHAPVEPAPRPAPAAAPAQEHAPAEPTPRPAIAPTMLAEHTSRPAPTVVPMQEHAPVERAPRIAPAVASMREHAPAEPASRPAPVQVDPLTPMQPAPHPLRASNLHPTASTEAATEVSADAPEADPASIEASAASQQCERCGQPLIHSQWLAMRRWGSCKACRSQAA